MRLKKKQIVNNSGKVTLIPEVEEDFWYLYNLILTGDVVKCSSYRKVTKDSTNQFIL